LVVGDTEKLAPLAEFPISVPPLALVYQLIVLPAEVADRFVLVPLQIATPLLGVTAVGAEGAFTTKLAEPEV